MPADFWRYTSYDDYRKKKEAEKAQQPVKPILPPLTKAEPQSNGAPSWLAPSIGIGSNQPAWITGGDQQPEQPKTPAWLNNFNPLGGSPKQPAAQQQEQQPSLSSIVQNRPSRFQQTEQIAAQKQNALGVPWFDYASEQDIKEWEQYNPRAGQPAQQKPAQLADIVSGAAANPLAQQHVTQPAMGTPEWQREQVEKVRRQGTEGLANTAGAFNKALYIANTAVDALTGTIFGTIDSWIDQGALTPEEAAQFKQIYDSLDPAIHPQIRAAMAREKLPSGLRKKIYEAADWTAQNLARQAGGEYFGSLKGSLEGAKQCYQQGGIGCAVQGFVQGSDVGGKNASVGKMLAEMTLRTLMGGPAIGVYGQGLDLDIMARMARGEWKNKELWQDIKKNRDHWKKVNESAPGIWQFATDMVYDPINIASMAMGAAKGAMGKATAKLGQETAETYMAKAAMAGLGSQYGDDVLRAAAQAAGQAEAMAFAASAWTPELQAIYGVTQALDFAQNKGFLATSETPVSMYLMQQAMSEVSPVIMRGVGEAISGIVRSTDHTPDIGAIARELGEMHYKYDSQLAAEGKADLPEYTFYKDAKTDEIVRLPTKDYYVQMIEDGLTQRLDIDLGDGRKYATLGDMIIDFARRDVLKPSDFFDYTEPGLAWRKGAKPDWVKTAEAIADAEYLAKMPTGATPRSAQRVTPGEAEFVPPEAREAYGARNPLRSRVEVPDGVMAYKGDISASEAAIEPPTPDEYAALLRRAKPDMSEDELQGAVRDYRVADDTWQKRLAGAAGWGKQAESGQPVRAEAPLRSEAPTAVRVGDYVRLPDNTVGRVVYIEGREIDVSDGVRMYYKQDVWDTATADDYYADVLARANAYSSKATALRKEAAEYNRYTGGEATRRKGLVEIISRDEKGGITGFLPVENGISATHRKILADAKDAADNAKKLYGLLPKKESSPRATITVRSIKTERIPGSANIYRVTNIGKEVLSRLGWENILFEPGQPQKVYAITLDGKRVSLFDGDVRNELIPYLKDKLKTESRPLVNQPASTDMERASAPTAQTTQPRVEAPETLGTAGQELVFDNYGEAQYGGVTIYRAAVTGETNPTAIMQSAIGGKPTGEDYYVRIGNYVSPRFSSLDDLKAKIDEYNRVKPQTVAEVRSVFEGEQASDSKPAISTQTADVIDRPLFIDDGSHIGRVIEWNSNRPVYVIPGGGKNTDGTPIRYTTEQWKPVTKSLFDEYIKRIPATSRKKADLDIRAWYDEFLRTQATRPSQDASIVAGLRDPELSATNAKRARETSESLEPSLESIAAQYGWSIRDNALYNRAGRKVHDVEIKKNRIRLLSDGKMYAAFPASNPELLGEYLEKTYYARKNDTRPIIGKPSTPIRDTVIGTARAPESTTSASPRAATPEPASTRPTEASPAAQETKPAASQSKAELGAARAPETTPEQEPATARMPETPETERAASKNIINHTTGKNVTAFRTAAKVGEESGKTLYIPSRYALGELDDVQPSHLLDTFELNPQYPQELQQRDYNTSGVKGIVQAGINDPNYRALVMPSETIDEGVPLVRSDGMVINGTNRRLIAEGISRDPNKWALYQAELRRALPEVGIPESELAKYKKPYLYRLVNDDVPESDILLASQPMSTTKELSTQEAAQIQSKTINLNLLAKIEPGTSPGETLRAQQNQFFIQEYLNNQPLNHRNALLSADGRLTDDGVNEIRNAMFLAVYGKKGERLLAAFTSDGSAKTVQDALFNSLPDIARAESMIAQGLRDPSLSLADDFITAVDALIDMRQKGQFIEEYLGQHTLAGLDTRVPLTTVQRHLLTIFDEISKGRRVGLRKVLKAYANKVSDPPQVSMFGDGDIRTAGQLLNEALVENGIEGVKLFDSMPRSVQPAPPPATPADSPDISFEKPVYTQVKTGDDEYAIEWAQLVNRGGNAEAKDTPVFRISSKDWLALNDKQKRALVEAAVDKSAWSIAKDKAERIRAIIDGTNEWANKIVETRVDVQQGKPPEAVIEPAKTDEPEVLPPEQPGMGEQVSPQYEQVPRVEEQAQETTPPPAQPETSGGGRQRPPRKPITIEGFPPGQQPSTGGNQPPGGTPPPRQPSGQPQRPNTQAGGRLPNMPNPGTQQRGTQNAPRQPRIETPVSQAQMPTTPGNAPVSGGQRLFQPQERWQTAADTIRENVPWMFKKIDNPAARKVIATPLKMFAPEVQGREVGGLAGMVYGRIVHEGDTVLFMANNYLKSALKNLEDTGLKIKTVKRGAPGGKMHSVEIIEGLEVVPRAEQQPGRYTPEELDELAQMEPLTLDVFSYPERFRPTTTDQALAARQKQAIQDVTHIINMMIEELRNDGKSRGMRYDDVRTRAEYYIPRNVDEVNDIAPLRMTDNEAARTFLTATKGVNDPEETTEYFNLEASVMTYLRKITNAIANHETAGVLRDLFDAKTLQELVPQDMRTRLAEEQQHLSDVEDVLTKIRQFKNAEDPMYPGAAIPSSVLFVDGQLQGLNISDRITQLAHETDPAVRATLYNALKADIADLHVQYKDGVSKAEKAIETAKRHAEAGTRVSEQQLGTGTSTRADIEMKKVNLRGEETLYMKAKDADEVNAWFAEKGEKGTLEFVNSLNTLAKMTSQSLDLEMATRFAGYIVSNPKAYLKSMVSIVNDPYKMAEWMARPENAETIRRMQNYGANFDTSAEFVESQKDLRRGGALQQFMASDIGQRIQGLAANPANMLQILAFQRAAPGIEAKARARAARRGITSPDGIQQMIDSDFRGYIKAQQDYYGLRSMLGSGVSPRERALARTIFMSGRKTSGWVNVPFNMLKGGAEGHYTRLFMARELLVDAVAASALYVAWCAARGIKIDLESEEFKNFIDPNSPDFASITIGGTRIGPGGNLLRDIRMWGRIVKAAQEDPKQLTKLSSDNQLLQYWMTRGSPAVNFVKMLAEGKTFTGERLDAPYKVFGMDKLTIPRGTGAKIARLAGETGLSIMPMTFQNLIEPSMVTFLNKSDAAFEAATGKTGAEASAIVGAGKALGAAVSWLGGRTVNQSAYQLLKASRNLVAQKEYGKNARWDDLDTVDKWRLGQAYPELAELEEAVDEGYAAKNDPKTQFDIDVRAERERVDVKRKEYERQLLAGEITGRQYREKTRELDAYMAEVPLAIRNANPEYKDVPVTPEERKAYYAKFNDGKMPNPVDTFIEEWYAISRKPNVVTNEITGELDFDQFYAERDALIARTDPLVVAKAMPYINRYKSDLVVKAADAYNKYMKLPKYEGITNKEDEKAIDAYLQKRDRMRDSGVKDYKYAAIGEKGSETYRGYMLYESLPRKSGTNARDAFMFKYKGDNQRVLTTEGQLIKLFYADLTLPDVLETTPNFLQEVASLP